MPRGRQRRFNGRRSRSRVSTRRISRMDRGVGTIRLRTSYIHIPPNTKRPKVQKWVRVLDTLTSSGPILNVTPILLAGQDGTDYGVATVRYSGIRVLRMRAWLEGPPASATQVAFGIVLTDGVSDTAYTDRPVSGASIAGASMQFCLDTREDVQSTASGAIVATVQSDVTIPAATILLVTIDVLCEFS